MDQNIGHTHMLMHKAGQWSCYCSP